jgi:hypothetical protein
MGPPAVITVACVEWGDYLGRGTLYVRALAAMVADNLPEPHRFVCLTDQPARHPGIDCVELQPGRVGWWNKLELFRPGLFEGRVLFLDLDSIITGPLTELVESKGIIHLRDWGWTHDVYGSGVMVWDAGEHADVWICADPRRFGTYHGDQDFITELGGWDRFPPHLARSYRYHCKDIVPKGCAVVCFHGEPKPHQESRIANRPLQHLWQRAAAKGNA